MRSTLEDPLDWPLINGFYRECNDLNAIETAGIAPLKTMLANIDALQTGVFFSL